MSHRLIKSNSPYLLQHSNNPVDWYPWGKDAFNKAKKSGVKILCYDCKINDEEVKLNNQIEII